jgi:hypothetical protein
VAILFVSGELERNGLLKAKLDMMSFVRNVGVGGTDDGRWAIQYLLCIRQFELKLSIGDGLMSDKSYPEMVPKVRYRGTTVGRTPIARARKRKLKQKAEQS